MLSTEKKFANPAPLGLAGFGFTTVLLNLVNAGVVGKGTEVTLVVTMGLFYGGLCQLIAGLVSFRRGECFGATAFSSYGAFWETLAVYLLIGPILG